MKSIINQTASIDNIKKTVNRPQHVVGGETLSAIRGGKVKKGDVLGVARIAGIMAAKRTASLIPLCHPLFFDSCAVDFTWAKVKSKPFVR